MPLEPGLGYNQDVTREYVGIGTDVGPVNEIVDTDPKLLPLTVYNTHDNRLVPVSKLRQPADSNYQIK